MPKWYDEGGKEVTDPDLLRRLESSEGMPPVTRDPSGISIGPPGTRFSDPPAPQDQTWTESATSFGKGALQGAVLDPVEGIGQLYEHATGAKIPLPQGVRDWASDFEQQAGATRAGKFGNLTGTVASMLIPGYGLESLAARSAGLASKGAKVANLTTKNLKGSAKILREAENTAFKNRAAVGKYVTQNPIKSKAAIGAASGGIRKADDDENFAKEKLKQVLAGAAGGAVVGTGLIPKLARGVASHGLTRLPLHYGIYHLLGHPSFSIPAMITLEALARQMRTAGARSVLDTIVKHGMKPGMAGAAGAVAGEAEGSHVPLSSGGSE